MPPEVANILHSAVQGLTLPDKPYRFLEIRQYEELERIRSIGNIRMTNFLGEPSAEVMAMAEVTDFWCVRVDMGPGGYRELELYIYRSADSPYFWTTLALPDGDTSTDDFDAMWDHLGC
jgi:hypothetical protein